MKVTWLIIPLACMALGWMPMQTQQAPTPEPPLSGPVGGDLAPYTGPPITIPPLRHSVAESLPTTVVSDKSLPAPTTGTITERGATDTECLPVAGDASRRIWVCEGRHTITYSEPQAWCRASGRQTICERE
jgi:hypothetical protein